ncbi:MAG: sulfotransferase family 2 domain-containing protein [Acidimicrobiales bacterium]|nr:sulfotransferase family 2 domain-containing protein [Acidimicrobiales bacterium]
MSEPLPKVCFLHIPKTAGTSVCKALESFYAPEQVSPARLLTDLKHPQSGFSLWHGHFGLRDIQGHVPEDVTYLATLRDPVQRVLSLYSYWRNVDLNYYTHTADTDPNYHGVMLAQEATLDEFLQTSDRTILSEISNAACRYLAGGIRDASALDWSAALASVEAHDITVFDVGSDLDAELSAYLQGLFGAAPALTRENEGGEKYVASDQEISAIEELNRDDIRLYRALT